MTPQDVIKILKTAERQGADRDEPEGARYIHISDTLTWLMAEALERSIVLSPPQFEGEVIKYIASRENDTLVWKEDN